MPGVDVSHDETPSAAGDAQGGDPGIPSSDDDPGPQDPGDDSQPDPADPDAGDPDQGPQFSFFITSLQAMRQLSGSQDGFGGDLGGLAGADQICQTIAEGVGAGHLTWRAFLSAVQGDNGNPVNAIERIGDGPWYDANLRLVAEDIAGLLRDDRPDGNAQIVDDLPDEFGVPLSTYGDSHDILTASNSDGELNSTDPASTCQDWTSSASGQRGPQCGHSWPRRGAENWISAHKVPGCTPGVNLIQNGAGSGECVGCAGGYGGIYCFALTP